MNPEDLDGLFERVNELLDAGKPAEAMRRLDRISADALEDEDRIEWATLRAWALSELDRDEEALELLGPMLEEFPQSARLYGALGVVLSNSGELEDAREALETAVGLDGEDEVLLSNLALVYEKLRDYARAIELYDRAIGLGADIDWALSRKACAQTEMGAYGAAKTTLKRYLSLDPDDPRQWIELAILHSDDSEFEQAFECYREAERIDRDSAQLRLNWGVTAVRAGRLDVAREQQELLRQIEPDSTRHELLQAFIVEEAGDIAGARAIYEKVLHEVDAADYGELTYALEMAMDFYSRRKAKKRCHELLKRAYAENAGTVELCEAYREATDEPLDGAHWYSLMVEAKYRVGLSETYERGHERDGPFTHFQRNIQVVATDRDDAAALALDFMREMGESDPRILEFIGESKVEPTPPGIYEIERESLVFAE